MFGWLLAPRLEKSDACLIAGRIAREIVFRKLSTKEALGNIEDLLSKEIVGDEKYGNYKVTNEEAKCIARQVFYNVEHFRDLIDEHISMGNTMAKAHKEGGHVSFSRTSLDEGLKYQDDTVLNDFPWK